MRNNNNSLKCHANKHEHEHNAINVHFCACCNAQNASAQNASARRLANHLNGYHANFLQRAMTKIIRVALLGTIVASIGVIAGCGLLGPSYHKPDTATPSKWQQATSSDSSVKDRASAGTDASISLPEMAWWQSFADPVLNDLIALALVHNNSINQAIGNVITAKGSLQQVQMAWVPTLSGNVGYTGTSRIANSSGQLNGNNGFMPSGEGYSAGLLPSYSLNIFQQIKANEQAKANYLANQYAKDAVTLSVISQVVGSYFTLLSQTYQQQLQKQLVLDSKAQYELGVAEYKQGFISLLTLQQYEQQYYNALAQLPVIANNIVQSQNALRVLVGRNPGYINNKADFVAIKTNGIIPLDLPSVVLANRPDVKQAEEQLIAANANIGVARANFFPSINLTSTLGTSSAGLENLFSGSSDYWANQIAATMPILNLSYLGTIKQARGQYYTAYYNYILTVESAFAQVENGLSGHDKLTTSYKMQTAVYDSAKQAYALGDARYKNGADSYLKALEYKIAMDNAGIQWVNAKMQQLQSIVNLYQALAGGYLVNNANVNHTSIKKAAAKQQNAKSTTINK